MCVCVCIYMLYCQSCVQFISYVPITNKYDLIVVATTKYQLCKIKVALISYLSPLAVFFYKIFQPKGVIYMFK